MQLSFAVEGKLLTRHVLVTESQGDDLAIVCLTQMKEAALYNEAITEYGASSTDAGTFEVAAVCRQAKLQLPIDDDDGIADGLHHLAMCSATPIIYVALIILHTFN